jgi:hypothetical protein
MFFVAKRFAFPILMSGFLVACGPGAGDSRAASSDRAAAVDLVGIVSMELGLVDGPDAYLFGRVGGIVTDSAGRLFIADAQANEIRVFTPDGEYLYGIGRAGEGPGEMQNPCCIAIDSSGELWVRDTGGARYNVYRPGSYEADFVRQVRMAHADPRYGAPTTFDPDGNLIDVGHRSDPGTGKRRLHRFHVDADGEVVKEREIDTPSPDELGAHTVEGISGNTRSTFFFFAPFAPGHFVAHSPDGDWAEASGSRYQARWYAPDGRLKRTVEVPGAVGATINPSERRAAEARIAEVLSGVGASPADARFRVPSHKPPLVNLFFDQSGRLWIQRSVPEGEANQADVYAVDGTMVAFVEWPAGIQLARGFVRDDLALGLTTGEFGEPRVVQLDLVSR